MKNKILAWLFKDYAKRLKEESSKTLELQMEAYKATFNVKDAIRERLKGIRPNNPDDNSILNNHLSSLDDQSRLAFLSKAYEIIENNTTLKVVIDSIIIEQEHNSMMYASDMAEVNFGRGSINGVMLVEESLNSLSGMYKKEKEFNQKMSEEERLSVL